MDNLNLNLNLNLESDLPLLLPSSHIILTAGGDPIEAHRLNDPNIWGLLDVSLRRRTLVPVTIYKTSGDSASGVCGMLMPSGEFRRIQSGGLGEEETLGSWYGVHGVQGEPTTTLTREWNGACPSPEFEVTDDDGVPTGDGMRRERTRGQLLGAYSRKGAPGLGTSADDRKRVKITAMAVATAKRAA